jgi:hypothetical protein
MAGSPADAVPDVRVRFASKSTSATKKSAPAASRTAR